MERACSLVLYLNYDDLVLLVFNWDKYNEFFLLLTT
jgi:hypothetical protein